VGPGGAVAAASSSTRVPSSSIASRNSSSGDGPLKSASEARRDHGWSARVAAGGRRWRGPSSRAARRDRTGVGAGGRCASRGAPRGKGPGFDFCGRPYEDPPGARLFESRPSETWGAS
jgi:hypothetical protein